MTIPLPPKKFLRLFACCLLVRGPLRTVLLDTQRQQHYFLPNGLHDLLGPAHSFAVAEALAAHPGQTEVVQQYVDFLLTHELAFLTDEVARFPAINLAFRAPEPITNAVIDVDAASNFDFRQLAAQLDALKCKSLQLRFNCRRSYVELIAVLQCFDYSMLYNLEIFVPADDAEFESDSLIELARQVPRLNLLYLYGADANRVIFYRRQDLRVVYTRETLSFPACCGVVQPHYFTYDLGHASEATAYNSCLNRKIALDARGNIRNCPSMARSYGNIATTTLTEALQHPQFREVWGIAKSQVQVCQDCEFRLVCTDCRAYLEDPQNPLSKPLKCGYDPYTATWHEWSSHPLKQAALDYYHLPVSTELG